MLISGGRADKIQYEYKSSEPSNRPEPMTGVAAAELGRRLPSAVESSRIAISQGVRDLELGVFWVLVHRRELGLLKIRWLATGEDNRTVDNIQVVYLSGNIQNDENAALVMGFGDRT